MPDALQFFLSRKVNVQFGGTGLPTRALDSAPARAGQRS
jgi:hypothetical protein